MDGQRFDLKLRALFGYITRVHTVSGLLLINILELERISDKSIEFLRLANILVYLTVGACNISTTCMLS